MNNGRRKAIAALLDKIAELRNELETRVGELVSEVESIRDEEQEAFDNLPEAFQEGDKGEAAQAAIDALDEALSGLEELQGFDFDTIEGPLDTAKE